MNKRLILLIALVCISLVFLLLGCGQNREGQSKTPDSSNYQKGRDYIAIKSDFEGNGFTNIKTEAIGDLITGWLTKDGEVEKVSVGGIIEFDAGVWFDSNTEVIIYYHTFSSKIQKSTENISSTEQNNDTVNEVDTTTESAGIEYENGYIIADYSKKHLYKNIQNIFL